jgi:signal transduction histidine kinase
MSVAPLDSPPSSTLEREVDDLRVRMRELQSMAVLGELLSTTTHEFNNVLTTILNYAKLAIRYKDDAAASENALRKILAAGERGAKITSTILATARNRSPDYAPTDLSQMVEDALVLLERELMRYRVRVDFQRAEVPRVRGVGNQLQQVLINLLVNARQAMPHGGEVRITLRHDEQNRLVELSIRDTGSGIPADQLRHIFEPYFTSKSGPDETGKGGTGLGLAACSDIIKAHQGRIRVESTVGIGTAFTIRLPVWAD